jgi:hypothetical protein
MKLDFDIENTSPARFLERYLQIINADSKTTAICYYILIMGLMDLQTLNFLPSQQAAAAIYLSFDFTVYPAKGINYIESQIGHQWQEVSQCSRLFYKLMKEYGTKYNNHANIYKMFAEEKTYFASEICL